MKTALSLIDRGLVPTALVRGGIRRLLAQRLREQESVYGADREAALARWLDTMAKSPIALVPEKANEQHYEVPPEFFELVLGKRLKYSSGLYATDKTTLDEAEEAMLALTCERARLEDGQEVLELGCGWGSLTLWMAEHYPNSRILAVSNSAPQRQHITEQASARGLANIQILTRNADGLDFARTFDRIVSVEMFEHMRNWRALMERMAHWLSPRGRIFLHVFAHREYAYPFEVRGTSDWMSEHFFSGGMMPSHDLASRVTERLEELQRWEVSGEHYARTSEHWLENIDAQRAEVLALFRNTYGEKEAVRWLNRWRVFFLSCAELFGYRDGNEWIVSHHLLRAHGEGR